MKNSSRICLLFYTKETITVYYQLRLAQHFNKYFKWKRKRCKAILCAHNTISFSMKWLYFIMLFKTLPVWMTPLEFKISCGLLFAYSAPLWFDIWLWLVKSVHHLSQRFWPGVSKNITKQVEYKSQKNLYFNPFFKPHENHWSTWGTSLPLKVVSKYFTLSEHERTLLH